MSRSHDFEALLQLARACRARAGNEIALCFACTGTNLPALKAAVRPDDTNIRFAPFADEATIQRRFEAADFHLGSLRPEFTGIVVPSKFFAALAVGAAVHLRRHGRSQRRAVDPRARRRLRARARPGRRRRPRLTALKDDPRALRAGRDAAFAAYHRHFSKRLINDRWAALLERSVAPFDRRSTIC